MHKWFMHLWDTRSTKVTDEYSGYTSSYVKCFECDKLLREETYKEISTCYSHILSKTKYARFAGQPWNVVICCPDCHNLYSYRPKEAKKQYALYLQLKEKYNV